MNFNLTERGLLRTLVGAGIVLFGAFLLWRFLAGVASVVLLILLGVLLAVMLSWPVEALRRLKVPRSVSSPLIVVGGLAALLLIGYLFLPQLGQQSIQLIAGVVAAVFLGVYLAARPAPVVDWIVRLFPPDHRLRTREILSKSRDTLLSWFKGQLISMTIIGTLSTIALLIIGIPGAVILGILSGLLEFVPYVGPILSAVAPALIGFATGGFVEGLYVVVAYVIIQQVETNIVSPLVYRKVVDVHPAVTIAIVLLLGTVFGLLGVLLAVPTAVVAGILVHELWFRRLERKAGNEKEAP